MEPRPINSAQFSISIITLFSFTFSPLHHTSTCISHLLMCITMNMHQCYKYLLTVLTDLLQIIIPHLSAEDESGLFKNQSVKLWNTEHSHRGGWADKTKERNLFRMLVGDGYTLFIGWHLPANLSSIVHLCCVVSGSDWLQWVEQRDVIYQDDPC